MLIEFEGIQVGTFDETRKELTKDIKQILSKTRLSLNETNQSLTTTFSSFLAHLDSIDNDNERFDDWIRLTSDEIRLLGKQNPPINIQNRYFRIT